jgi:tetratricopeptide (TPR) repeat protein
MKTCIHILTIITLLSSCQHRQENFQDRIQEIKQNFSKQAEADNAEILAWEKTIDSIYNLADTDRLLGIRAINDIMAKDTKLNSRNLFDLYFIRGGLYFRSDSLQKALQDFSENDRGERFSSPKMLAARAGVYIKLKQFDKAFKDLSKAAEVNHSYNWNVGNYYEIIGRKDSAILSYQNLYHKDTVIYKMCLDRITELEKNKPKLFKELIYTDRERKVLLMHGVD